MGFGVLTKNTIILGNSGNIDRDALKNFNQNSINIDTNTLTAINGNIAMYDSSSNSSSILQFVGKETAGVSLQGVNNLDVNGNLKVLGDQTIINTETFSTKDAHILVNINQSGIVENSGAEIDPGLILGYKDENNADQGAFIGFDQPNSGFVFRMDLDSFSGATPNVQTGGEWGRVRAGDIMGEQITAASGFYGDLSGDVTGDITGDQVGNQVGDQVGTTLAISNEYQDSQHSGRGNDYTQYYIWEMTDSSGLGKKAIDELDITSGSEIGLVVGGASVMSGDLMHWGDSKHQGNLTMTGNQTMSGDLTMVGNQSMSGNLNVTSGTVFIDANLPSGQNGSAVPMVMIDAGPSGTSLVASGHIGTIGAMLASEDITASGSLNAYNGIDMYNGAGNFNGDVEVTGHIYATSDISGSNLYASTTVTALDHVVATSGYVHAGTHVSGVNLYAASGMFTKDLDVSQDARIVGTSNLKNTIVNLISYTNHAKFILDSENELYINGASGIFLQNTTAGVVENKWQIDKDGAAEFVSIFTQSDRNKKTDIYSIPKEKSLNKIKQLRPVSYYFKDNLTELRYGLIAQELEKVDANLVKQDENGIYSVNYIDIIAFLIGSVQTLNERIDNMSK